MKEGDRVERPAPVAPLTINSGTRRSVCGGGGKASDDRLRATSLAGLLSIASACVLVAAAAVATPAPAFAAACPNEAIREQQGSTFLPDCRAWERVSPADKNGGTVRRQTVGPQSTSSGDGLLYSSTATYGDGEGSGIPNYYIGDRGTNGWQTRAVGPKRDPSAASLAVSPLFLAASQDLSQAILQTLTPLAPGAPQGSQSLYVATFSPPAYRLLTDVGPSFPSEFYAPAFDAASDDFEHVLFESTAALTPDAPPFVPNLYEADADGIHLVSILPGGVVAPSGATAGGPGGMFASLPEETQQAMSADGSRVIFTDRASRQIYLREAGETIEVSASQRALPDPNGEKPAIFLGATRDGSTIFFSSGEKLTEDATTGPNSEGRDLYRFDVADRELTDLTVDTTDPASIGANVEGVVGFSQDGDTIYFVTHNGEPLAPGGGSGDPTAYELYVWSHGAIRFIASLSQGDVADWARTIRTSWRMDQVTSDGAVMVFASQNSLTGFANQGTQQLYRYSLAAGAFTCVSCKVGLTATPTDSILAGLFNYGFTTGQALRNNPSTNGNRVFFETSTKLVPEASNGRPDVYEWEAPGEGSCVETSPRFSPEAGGCVYLISGGLGSKPSEFMEANPDGSSVFFVTRERLVPSDRDELSDMYVARVDGGFSEPLGGHASCAGEDCQGEAAAGTAPRMIGSEGANAGPSGETSTHAKHKAKRGHHQRAKHRRHQAKRCGKGKKQGAARRCAAKHRCATARKKTTRRCTATHREADGKTTSHHGRQGVER